MVEVIIKVEGLDKAIASASGFPGAVDENMSKVMGRAANQGMTWMYPDTPVGNTMALRNSLFSRQIGQTSMEIGANSLIGVYVHQGTRPHEIVPVRAQALRFRAGGIHGRWVFARRVWHPGTKPNPFVRRTVVRLVRFIRTEFLDRMSGFLRLNNG